jgi:hypothetical protein
MYANEFAEFSSESQAYPAIQRFLSANQTKLQRMRPKRHRCQISNFKFKISPTEIQFPWIPRDRPGYCESPRPD